MIQTETQLATVEELRPPRRSELREVAQVDIHDPDDNVRRELGELENLEASIREHGVVQPVVVRPHGGGSGGDELTAGFQRSAVARLAGLVTVPPVVRCLTRFRVLGTAARRIAEDIETALAHRVADAGARSEGRTVL